MTANTQHKKRPALPYVAPEVAVIPVPELLQKEMEYGLSGDESGGGMAKKKTVVMPQGPEEEPAQDKPQKSFSVWEDQ